MFFNNWAMREGDPLPPPCTHHCGHVSLKPGTISCYYRLLFRQAKPSVQPETPLSTLGSGTAAGGTLEYDPVSQKSGIWSYRSVFEPILMKVMSQKTLGTNIHTWRWWSKVTVTSQNTLFIHNNSLIHVLIVIQTSKKQLNFSVSS